MTRQDRQRGQRRESQTQKIRSRWRRRGQFDGALEHAELMPQGEVLGGKRCSGAEENDRQPDERAIVAESSGSMDGKFTASWIAPLCR